MYLGPTLPHTASFPCFQLQDALAAKLDFQGPTRRLPSPTSLPPCSQAVEKGEGHVGLRE